MYVYEQERVVLASSIYCYRAANKLCTFGTDGQVTLNDRFITSFPNCTHGLSTSAHFLAVSPQTVFVKDHVFSESVS